MARGAERQVAKEATQEPLAAAKGAVVGYARTSTADQEAGLAAQERDLRAAGCGKVFSERVSSVGKRAQLRIGMELASVRVRRIRIGSLEPGTARAERAVVVEFHTDRPEPVIVEPRRWARDRLQGIEAIESNDVDVALQLPMLKAIVQNQDVSGSVRE